MVSSTFLMEQYTGTYNQLKKSTAGITHAESLRELTAGVNCLNWLVGHIVVARTNFMTFLDVPSIWTMAKIRQFIPGSVPNLTESEAVPLAELLIDLDRTQEQLKAALDQVATQQLKQVRDDRSIAEHLTFYAVHEAQHTGQIELISLILKR